MGLEGSRNLDRYESGCQEKKNWFDCFNAAGSLSWLLFFSHPGSAFNVNYLNKQTNTAKNKMFLLGNGDMVHTLINYVSSPIQPILYFISQIGNFFPLFYL